MKPMRGKTPKKPPRKNPKQTDPVEVYCRLRPLESKSEDRCCKAISTTVAQLTPSENSHAAKNGMFKEQQYTFAYVFDEYTSQKAVFDHISLPLVEDVLRGKNALLFAYGVTSSGKTHTMTGSLKNQGILPRCLDVIFNSIGHLQAKKYVFRPDKMNSYDIQTEAEAMLERQRRDIMPKLMNTPKTPGRPKAEDKFDPNTPRVRDMSRVEDVEEDNNYAVFVSYVEIYNNYIYDLLEELPYDPIKGTLPPTSKILREDAEHNMYVSGCVEVEIKSTEEAYDLLRKGQNRRRVAHTALNTESSRSHSVFMIRVVQGPLDPQGEEVLQDKEKLVVSQVALVDLAGSERLTRTGNQGERLKEASNINQSLMVLRTCIEALRENQKGNSANKMVPYRDSRLTHLFKNYFDGEGKVRMIVCVNPKAAEYDETLHVMRFAELTQEVQIARPQQVRFGVGLTPGRRRMNQQYKDALAKAAEEGDDPARVPVPPPLVYSMGPGFPSLQLLTASDATILSELGQYLREREVRRQTLLMDLGRKQDQFREQLVKIDKENLELQQRVVELEAQLQVKDQELNKCERKMKAMEQTNTMLQKTTAMYERDRRDLQYELEEKDLRIQQEKSDRNRLQQDFQARLVLTERQMQTKLEREKTKVAQENAVRIRANQQKMKLLKNIINTDTTDSESILGDPSSTPRTTRYRSHTATMAQAKSEPNLASTPVAPSPAPRTHHVRTTTAASSRPSTRSRARSPPPLKPKPVMNPRHHHRRSRSQGDVWLDHRPTGTVHTGTIMQPKMVKKKSVTQLTEKAVQKGTKYCLTHQELDSEGEVATKLVKGNMVPTAGGGTAVIFNDVETVKQREPGDRKRRSPQPRPEDFEGEWTDPEDRCHVALEGHGYNKRLKQSRV